MSATYSVPRTHQSLLVLLPVLGACRGLFGMFTMYLPPLFPVLLRTTGGRLLLQHRPPRRGGRDRGLRAVLERGRLPDRPPVRRLPLLAGDASCLVAPPISLISKWKRPRGASRSFLWQIEGRLAERGIKAEWPIEGKPRLVSFGP